MKIIKEGCVSTDLHTNTYFGSKKDIVRALREGVIAENDATNMYEKIIDGINSYVMSYQNNMEVLSIIPEYNKIIEKIQEIADEEKKHIGEFQKLISLLDNNEINLYKDGAKEI